MKEQGYYYRIIRDAGKGKYGHIARHGRNAEEADKEIKKAGANLGGGLRLGRELFGPLDEMQMAELGHQDRKAVHSTSQRSQL